MSTSLQNVSVLFCFSSFPLQFPLSFSPSLTLNLTPLSARPPPFIFLLSPVCSFLSFSNSLCLSLSLSLHLLLATDQSLSSSQLIVIILVSSVTLLCLLSPFLGFLYRRSALLFTTLKLNPAFSGVQTLQNEAPFLLSNFSIQDLNSWTARYKSWRK